MTRGAGGGEIGRPFTTGIATLSMVVFTRGLGGGEEWHLFKTGCTTLSTARFTKGFGRGGNEEGAGRRKSALTGLAITTHFKN